MRLADFIREAAAELEALYPSHEARNMVLLLCESRLGVKSYTHIVEPGTEVREEMIPVLENDMERLLRCEPLQYVLGYAEFCDRPFKVDPRVLVPRPETEELVRHAELMLNGRSCADILDLCTGSGCIAWTLALDLSGSKVTAVDVSQAALDLAESQTPAALDSCHSGPRFIRGDVLSALPLPDAGFDLIVSNPPYVMESERSEMRRNVLDFEPSIALFVPDSDPLLFYRAIASHSRRLLRAGGAGAVEINGLLGPETEAVFKEAGFSDVRLEKDLSGRDRFVLFRQTATR